MAVLVGRLRKVDLTEDGEETIVAKGLLEIVVEIKDKDSEGLLEVEVEIKDKDSEGVLVGVTLFCKSAFCMVARASVTTSWPSAVTFNLTFDALMMSERRVPASLLILKAQP